MAAGGAPGSSTATPSAEVAEAPSVECPHNHHGDATRDSAELPLEGAAEAPTGECPHRLTKWTRSRSPAHPRSPALSRAPSPEGKRPEVHVRESTEPRSGSIAPEADEEDTIPLNAAETKRDPHHTAKILALFEGKWFRGEVESIDVGIQTGERPVRGPVRGQRP